jgi:hypothetical protein
VKSAGFVDETVVPQWFLWIFHWIMPMHGIPSPLF